MNVLSLSQASNASTDDGEEERRQALIVYMLEKYTKKQRKEISTLNHAVTEISKDNDAFLTEIEEKSLEMLNQSVNAARVYFTESQESTAALVASTVIQLSKTCERLAAKLNRVSENVDPYDAEEAEVHLAEHYSDSIRQIDRWRRRIVKDNYNEMKKHQAKVQDATNSEEVAKATMVLMKANLAI